MTDNLGTRMHRLMPEIEPMTHWDEWRSAAARTGFTDALARAAKILGQMDAARFDPAHMEQLFAAAQEQHPTTA